MITALSQAALALLDATPVALSAGGSLPSYRLADDSGPIVLLAEFDAYRPGTVGTPVGQPELALAPLALTTTPQTIEDFQTIRASDVGYVSRSTDSIGVVAYPPILSSGIELDRQMDFGPAGQGAAAGWGALRLADNGSLPAIIANQNIDARAIRVRMGRRSLVAASGYWRDPAYNDTAELLNGIGASWTLTETEATIRFRDPGYWLDDPLDGTAFAGTGGLEGSAALTGKRKPKLRGGTNANPVRHIPAVLVNETSGIYQVSDTTGGIVALYERGLTGGIAFAGAVGDITAASPAAGTYVVESSARGLFFRLGTFPPAGLITVDAWANFPDGTVASAPAALVLNLLTQDLGVPATFIDTASFTGMAAAYNWTAGEWLFDQPVTGRELVGRLLRSCSSRLVPRRTGRLAAIGLTAFGAGAIPVASYSTAQILSCQQRELPAPLAPPPYRIRVGVQRYFATQTQDIAPTVTGATRQNLAEAYRVRTSAGSGVLTDWRRPSDPPIVETSLTSTADGDSLAAILRDLWSVPTQRTLWDVTLPIAFALRHDLGDPVRITYPGLLAAGALGRIVGEQFRTADQLATLQVLV